MRSQGRFACRALSPSCAGVNTLNRSVSSNVRRKMLVQHNESFVGITHRSGFRFIVSCLSANSCGYCCHCPALLVQPIFNPGKVFNGIRTGYLNYIDQLLRRRDTAANVLFDVARIRHITSPIAEGRFVTIALRLRFVVSSAVCVGRTDIRSFRVLA